MAETGRVTLVGAGPGDPGLLTLDGRRALMAADAVFYDRLVGDEIIAMIPGSAEKIDVGKSKGDHPTPQEEISRLLLRYARDGKNVVRLKGGDPFLFGRGAEELELLLGHGIPFRVVPGVTSALAVPAYAGIPVTHREYASSLHILTGHGGGGRPPAIPYAELARLPGTLVFLMATSTLDEICSGLVRAGMDADTPAALVENGATPRQRLLRDNLAGLPGRARAEAFMPPAVLVVGRVCALAGRFAWTGFLPLWGKRVLVVSSKATGDRLAERLRGHGCRVDEFAGIRREPLPQPDVLWQDMGRHSWIVFTSAFGAELFFTELRARRLDVRRLAKTKFAAVGGRTAGVLEERGIFPHLVPEAHNAADLGARLAELASGGETVLLYRARKGSPDLPRALDARGIPYDDVAAYETVASGADAGRVRADVRAGVYDSVAFASSSSVSAFAAAVGGTGSARPAAVCIGEATAAAARALGLAVAVSREASVDGMVELILETLGRTDESDAAT